MPKENLTIPLFPLQDSVLFPQTFLPLHIFEPRYQDMMREALEGDRLIGLAQLKPGWETDYFGNPAIYKFLGVGEITEHTLYEDGRYDLVLHGLYRGHILSESMKNTFRQATVEIVPDYVLPGQDEEVRRMHKSLQEILLRLSDALPAGYTMIPGQDMDTIGPGVLTDFLSSLLIDDPYERQSLLSEPSILRRQQLLRIQIKTIFTMQGFEFEGDDEV